MFKQKANTMFNKIEKSVKYPHGLEIEDEKKPACAGMEGGAGLPNYRRSGERMQEMCWIK